VRSGQITRGWANLAGWAEGKGQPPAKFWRTLVANRDSNGRLAPEYWSTACKEAFGKGRYEHGSVNISELIRNERNPILSRFCRRVESVVWNRRLAVTESNRLALVGDTVKVYDFVCILYGCSVPVILRQSHKKSQEEVDFEIEYDLRYFVDRIKKTYKKHAKWRRRIRQKKIVEKGHGPRRPGREDWWEFDLMFKYGRLWEEKAALRSRQQTCRHLRLRLRHARRLAQQDPTYRDRVKGWRLDDMEKVEYDRRIRRNYRLSAGYDTVSELETGPANFYYTFLGESYVHGIMDGQAIALQNELSIPSTVFELR
jgi:hypothetical protein